MRCRYFLGTKRISNEIIFFIGRKGKLNPGEGNTNRTRVDPLPETVAAWVNPERAGSLDLTGLSGGNDTGAGIAAEIEPSESPEPTGMMVFAAVNILTGASGEIAAESPQPDHRMRLVYRGRNRAGPPKLNADFRRNF